MRINTNVSALSAWRNLATVDHSLSKNIEKLSSGLRINRAADDAAGLAISEKLRAQVRGLNQAIRNAQDGISLIQTAEGGLAETHVILQRMRELAVQAASDTLTNDDRAKIQQEVVQLRDEIDRIGNNTRFKTINLLNGSAATVKIHVGANAGQNFTITINDMRASALGIATVSASTQAAADAAITTIDTAIGTVSTERSKLGALQNGLEHTVANLRVASENMAASESRIRDVDMALEMVAFTRNQILIQAGTAMLAQANVRPQLVLQLLG